MAGFVWGENARELEVKRVGIDFGTSNTAASVYGVAQGSPVHHVIPLDGDALIKTLLYFPNGRESFFGREAVEKYFDQEREGRLFQSIKRLLPNPDFNGTQISGRHVSLESLIARFLEEVRKRIAKSLGCSLVDLDEIEFVLGRPAKYSLDAEREELATTRFCRAIELAGFKKYQLLEEPTAASRVAMQSGAQKDGELTFVADLGGGTSDFTVLRKRNVHSSGDEVLAVHGVPLAGDALDSSFVSDRLLTYFGSEVTYQRPFSSNILTFPKALISRIPKWHQHVILKEKSNWNFILELRKELVKSSDRLYLENLITLVEENLGYMMHRKVEEVKVSLSLSQQPQAAFQFASYPIKIELDVHREDYEGMIAPIVEQVASTSLATLKMAQIEPEQVSILYFTGGTSQVPAMRRAIQGLFPHAKVRDQDSFTAVALGLSLP